jgi:hypothetical protein
MELRQLNPADAVRGPHHGDIGAHTLEPDRAVHPRPLVRRLALQLHTELGKERLGSLEVIDNDEHVVHPLKRHIVISWSPGPRVAALHLVSEAGQSSSTCTHSSPAWASERVRRRPSVAPLLETRPLVGIA